MVTHGTNVAPAVLVQNGFPLVTLPAKEPVAGTNLEVSRDDYPTQYATQWFFDLQRELPGDILLAVGYQGAKSTHLFGGRNINNGGPHPTIQANQRRVRPKWNNITLRDNGDNSNYNAFVLKAEKRFSKGLTFISSYTWSHTIDQNEESLDENLSGQSQRIRPPQRTRQFQPGPAAQPRGQLHLRDAVRPRQARWERLAPGAEAILGGWQVGGILSLMTGVPFDVTYPGDTQNSGDAQPRQPHRQRRARQPHHRPVVRRVRVRAERSGSLRQHRAQRALRAGLAQFRFDPGQAIPRAGGAPDPVPLRVVQPDQHAPRSASR